MWEVQIDIGINLELYILTYKLATVSSDLNWFPSV